MGYNKEYYQAHREEILAKQHRYYWNNPERYRNYCKEYKKKNKEERKKYEQKYRLTPSSIWTDLGKSEKREISKEDFIKWYNSQDKKCVYCGILGEEIRGEIFRCWETKRLQIDRKDSDKPYKEGNLVLACPICNFIKGSYFTYNEMLKIGEIVKEIREKRKTAPA